MRYVDEFDQDSMKDHTRTRLIDVGFENPIKVTATDPYGHWNIAWHSGVTPKHLQGSYTTFELAQTAIKNHFKAKALQPKVQKVADTKNEIDLNNVERKERKETQTIKYKRTPKEK